MQQTAYMVHACSKQHTWCMHAAYSIQGACMKKTQCMHAANSIHEPKVANPYQTMHKYLRIRENAGVLSFHHFVVAQATLVNGV